MLLARLNFTPLMAMQIRYMAHPCIGPIRFLSSALLNVLFIAER